MQNWVEVTRPNGSVFYATVDKDGNYYRGGYGFPYAGFNGNIKALNGEPPRVLKPMMVCFDGERIPYKALVNVNKTWNGWLMPYINAPDTFRMLSLICNEQWMTYSFEDGIITVVMVQDDNETYVLEPQVMDDDETYYYFGDFGFTFEKYKP